MILKTRAEKGASSEAGGPGRTRCGIGSLHGRHVQGAGKEVEHRVQQRCTPLLRKAVPQRTGVILISRVARRSAGISSLGGQRLAPQVAGEEGVVHLAGGLHDLLARRRRGLLELVRHGHHVELRSQGISFPAQGAHAHHVHHAAEGVGLSPGDLHGDGTGVQALHHHPADAGEVGAHPVHLVDEGDAGERGTCRPGATRLRTAAPRRPRRRTRPPPRPAPAGSARPRR
jgi:hypothetical protein